MSDDNYELKDHQLFAATGKLWRKLRSENEISKSRKKMARKISVVIMSLAIFRGLQRIYLRFRLRNSVLEDDAPIFVIGHWRSGTTHLHYLLSQDARYSHLGSFQGFFFNIAFTTKWFFKPILRRVMPMTRPQDNVKIDVDAPTEDEHALVNVTKMSGMHMFFFPKNMDYFNKYNCFDGISEEELSKWKEDFSKMLKQIELFNGKDKKLLLKNPHSTARIKTLLEIYPKAKFVHIHRNPYDVFNSTRTLYEKAVRSQFLQEFSDEELNELILYCYEKMMSGYLSHRDVIPADQLIEIGYADLVTDPINVLEEIYTKLNLGEFATTKGRFEEYLTELGEYKLNPPKEIDPEMKEEIKRRWGFAFDEWKYQK